MAAQSQSSKAKRGWRLWLLIVVGGAVVLALLAPGLVGRRLGGRWVSVMGVVMGLIGALVGG